ncbi:Dyggve-Melchior-clausen syndrome domain containing protein [Nitzschia inconspicua]|uniref:Dymeclin n=1 Tax=Nitzschia inconspicua TaxID=303405 RepID=A0A9K3KNK6_9STRA|nr:Dyggve-Melchior-clausen syndrome domain containing protein [Nitzschia inconspicua]
MWGNPERAASLTGNDTLASLLYQVCSPAHIPWSDERWQELLHGYDVWVHMEDSHALMQQYAQSMAKHAEMSSNLAALSLHVTRMLRELVRDMRISQEGEEDKSSKTNGESFIDQPAIDDFSKRISRVAKARATAGSLQLLQLLSHPVIVRICKTANVPVDNLNDVFTYRTRGDLPLDQPAGIPLVHSILDLIVAVGNNPSVLNTPELYDTVVLAFQLLFVLCGTQLYRPFESSFERNTPIHGILEAMFQQDDNDDSIEESTNLQSLWMSSRSSLSISKKSGKRVGKRRIWTPQSILQTCLQWQLDRPPAPEGSLSHYYFILANAAVNTKGGEKPGQDGIYESYMIVQATAPMSKKDIDNLGGTLSHFSTTGNDVSSDGGQVASKRSSESHNIILDATKGVLTLGGKIILLPFRLVSLVVGVFAANKKGSHQLRQGEMMKKIASTSTSRTRDVLWLSNSQIADLASSLILLLANNNRNVEHSNPFRSQLKRLADNRWEDDGEGLALPDLPSLRSTEEDSFRIDDFHTEENDRRKSPVASVCNGDHPLTLNFESLFVAFGRTLHTEVGALLLYTLLQSSPSFAESLAARSDLDTLVMPLLRTLYFASRSQTYISKDYAARRASTGPSPSHSQVLNSRYDIRSCPFRSLSQLYVNIILLLLFSQDSSFGRDAFKRVIVSDVLWYKERHLKNINLGSVLLLTMLRSLLFNLSRLQDVFMLSNCCAVLMNISISVVGLHEYASMRLASVAVTIMKKHVKLDESTPESDKGRRENQSLELEEDLSSPLEMHAEVAHTLLAVIKQSLSPDNIEENLHLIYALVYYQTDLIKLCNNKNLYSPREIERIKVVTLKASSLIQNEGARSAPKALKVLEMQIESLVAAANAADAKFPSKRRRAAGEDEFTFTYEEESDPEIFFVPYVWDIIVCCTTSTNISWKKDNIQAFSLLDGGDEDFLGDEVTPIHEAEAFADNAEELV